MSFELTGLVIARDEALDLPDCLSSWGAVCDELVVVDNESRDETPEIARSFGAKVVEAYMEDETGFAGLRNTGLNAVETSHVLVFDADERPTPILLASIRDAVGAKREDTAYRFLRRNAAFGGWLDHGRFGEDWQTRLFTSDVRYTGIVHETPQLSDTVETLDLAGIAEHFTYSTLKEYKAKMRHYTEKQAQLQTKPSFGYMLGAPIYNLVVRQGYKDGWRGIALALGDGWRAHLVRKYQASAQILPKPTQASPEALLEQVS